MSQKQLNSIEKRINIAEMALKQKSYHEAIVLFNEIIEELRDLGKNQENLKDRADEIQDICNKAKADLRDEMIERCEFVRKEEKISLVLEYLDIIIKLSREINDEDSIKKYQDQYDEFKIKFDKKMAQNIQELIAKANGYKNEGEFEKAKDVYESALRKARDLNNHPMIEALSEQVTLINSIFLKEKRKKAIENAEMLVKNENFIRAIESYEIAARFSAELNDNENERKFYDEIKRLEKLKEKIDKQRKKVDKQIDMIIEKADKISNQRKYFDAIVLYREAEHLVKESYSQLEIEEGLTQKIIQNLEKHFRWLFSHKQKEIPPVFIDVIKIAEELKEQHVKLNITDLYRRSVKRILRPQQEITTAIYILHKLRLLI
ncbi:MAG: hypothetical protein ACTSRW_06790 [Candidatus Helarchaeota archaeon]